MTELDPKTHLRFDIHEGRDAVRTVDFNVPKFRIPVVKDTTRLFACLLDTALGEFIIRSVVCSSIKCHFDDAHMTVYFRDDRPYKSDIIEMNPFINKIAKSGDASVLPIEYFYPHGDRARIKGDDQFIHAGHSMPDLLITPSMMILTNLARFDYMAPLRIPPSRQPTLDQRLVDLGVDPNRWLCTIHHREPGYQSRPGRPYRDVRPENFIELTKWIIQEAGGQVVRIGHPGMTPFPDMPGFIDLSGNEEGFMLQANAVARSRFCVMMASGPGGLGAALGTPQAMTNVVGPVYISRPGDVTLPRWLRGPDGQFLDIPAAIEAGAWNEDLSRTLVEQKGFTAIDNSPEELIEVVKILLDQTTDVTGWRPPRDIEGELKVLKRPNEYTIYQPYRQKLSITLFPELAPRG